MKVSIWLSLMLSPVLFLSLGRSKCPTYIIFPLSEKLLQTYLARLDYWQKKFFNFCLPKKVFTSLSVLKDISVGCWVFFSISTLNILLHYLLVCIGYNSYLWSSTGKVFFFLSFFKDFFLYLWLSSLTIISVGVGRVCIFPSLYPCIYLSLCFLDLWFGIWH